MSDRSGGTTRKLPASFDESSTAPPPSRRPFMPMDAILQFEFNETPCGAENVRIPKMLQEGNVVFISRTEGETTSETPLYIRQHLVEKLQQMANEFENTKLLHAYITGAPGCGKTCFFWMWAFMKVQDNKRVLFIQHRETPAVWVLENNLLRRLTSPDVEDTDLQTVVLQLLKHENGKFDFAILDGVRMTEDASKTLMAKLKGKTGVLPGKKISKTVFVTSVQFRSPTGVVNRGVSFNKGVDISFDSWRESDYDCAVQYPSVTGNEIIRNILLEDWNLLTNQNQAVSNTEIQRIKEAVKLKYRYAGGCARFMFDYKVMDLKADLDLWMLTFKTADWEEFALNAVASGATIEVNTLMQRFAVGRLFYCIPVSEYVLRRAYQVCGSKLTNAVKSAAEMTKNPSLAGWAFEMGELDKINRALADNQQPSITVWSAIQISVVSSSTAVGERRPQQQLTLCPLSLATYKNGTLESENDIITSGTLITCDVWNQGCFDVALYIGTTLFTLQVTTAKSHSLLLNYLTELREALLHKNVNVNEVVHVAIVRNSNVEGFRFAQPQGTGRFMPNRNNPVDYHVRVVRELKKVCTWYTYPKCAYP